VRISPEIDPRIATRIFDHPILSFTVFAAIGRGRWSLRRHNPAVFHPFLS